MDAFSAFELTPYEFLELESTAAGNGVVSTTEATGVIKYRDGLTQDVRGEAYSSQATLHMKPDEPFIETVGGHLKLVGHGIRADGDDYRIDGVRVGTDFDSGQVAFYLCTLRKEALWESALPLE